MIGQAWKPALDKVWQFLGRNPGLRSDGHNVFVYRAAGTQGLLDVDFGVQVVRRFDGDGDVICAELPSGEAATVLHVGAYDRLGEAYAALDRWFESSGGERADISWEVYGDWSNDPARLETRIFWLLRGR